MAAPTKPADVKKSLANPEPSTHGPTARRLREVHRAREGLTSACHRRTSRSGLVVMPDGSFNAVHRAQIILLAARNNVPAVYFSTRFARFAFLHHSGPSRKGERQGDSEDELLHDHPRSAAAATSRNHA
jgi:hypothetical protein